MIERETHEHDVDTDFTASLLTVVSGRYDNESPPLFYIFYKHNYKTLRKKVYFNNFILI